MRPLEDELGADPHMLLEALVEESRWIRYPTGLRVRLYPEKSESYRCIRCRHQWTEAPGEGTCPQCGNLYVKWLSWPQVAEAKRLAKVTKVHVRKRRGGFDGDMAGTEGLAAGRQATTRV